MPQLGLHLILASEGSRRLAGHSRSLAIGVVLGSILPDLDFLLVVPVRLINRDLALSLHRSFSHSLFGVTLLVLAGLLVVLCASDRGKAADIGRLIAGIGIGAAVHVALDIVFWFDSVRAFWPLPREIYIYGDFIAPEWLRNTASAVEISCYGLFLLSIAPELKTRRLVKSIAIAMCVAGIPLVAAAPLLPVEKFEMIAYGVAIPLGFVPVVILTWTHFTQPNQMRRETK